MPCSDGMDYIQDCRDLEKHNTYLAQLLCEACKLLSNPDQTDRMSTELYDWKKQHDEFDRKNGR